MSPSTLKDNGERIWKYREVAFGLVWFFSGEEGYFFGLTKEAGQKLLLLIEHTSAASASEEVYIVLEVGQSLLLIP